MNRTLITGPDGFVGTALCTELIKRGFAVRGAQWKAAPLPTGVESVVVGDINGSTDWSSALEGIDAIIHLAARVHIMNDDAEDPLAAFREVNVDGTRRLAEDAAKAGIRRFMLMSTVKVNGEGTGGKAESRKLKYPTTCNLQPATKNQEPRAKNVLHTHPHARIPTHSSSEPTASSSHRAIPRRLPMPSSGSPSTPPNAPRWAAPAANSLNRSSASQPSSSKPWHCMQAVSVF
jgi:hypothetical protein